MIDWANCKNILVIRADNMGDVLMSGPAIRALSNSTGSRITLLTSRLGEQVGYLNPFIDEVICCDLPWVKSQQKAGINEVQKLIDHLKKYKFDGCVIFSVYSQNPLPAAMIAYLAEIPLRLAYCRENPYELLTHWVPDPEPYEVIKHQVQRDLDLVSSIGAKSADNRLFVQLPEEGKAGAIRKLADIGLDVRNPFLILHPGVSEQKRSYPETEWIKCGIRLRNEFNIPLLLTGTKGEANLLKRIGKEIGNQIYLADGILKLYEFAWTIGRAKAVISVNTGTIHLAAAVGTPVVVLYAQSNPQHTPWMVSSVVLEYSIPEEQRSRNSVISYVNRKLYSQSLPLPDEFAVTNAVRQIIQIPKNNSPTSFNTTL